MHFIIHCLDKVGGLPIRMAQIEAHRAYLTTAQVKVIISGPLMGLDNHTPVGSCFLVAADNLADVRAFNSGDPFFKAELWEVISIHAFDKRVDVRD